MARCTAAARVVVAGGDLRWAVAAEARGSDVALGLFIFLGHCSKGAVCLCVWHSRCLYLIRVICSFTVCCVTLQQQGVICSHVRELLQWTQVCFLASGALYERAPHCRVLTENPAQLMNE